MIEQKKTEKVSAVIAAAGSATRMNGTDKQMLLLDGIPVIMHSVLLFDKLENICDIVLVVKPEQISCMKKLCQEYNVKKPVSVVPGKSTRQDSVLAGIAACSKESRYLAIHDGARPLVSEKDVLQVFSDAFAYQAATLGVPTKDTIKIVDEKGFIQTTTPREFTYLIQTPQVFEKTLYLSGIAKSQAEGNNFTDDCQLIESLGKRVFITKGSYENIKITTPEDILTAQVFMEAKNRKDDQS